MSKKETLIPIVLICEEENIKSLSITLVSLLENVNKENKYDINIIIKSSYSQENTDLIFSLRDKYNCEITFTVINDIKKENIEDIAKSITSSLNEIDKCIYLNHNVVVQKDLSELYNFNFNDNSIVGVRQIDDEINSSVLLINSAKVRNNEIKIGELDLKFNLQSYLLKGEKSFNFGKQVEIKGDLVAKFDKKQLKAALRENVIFSYTDEVNPFNSSDCSFNDVWLDYYVLSPFFETKKLYNDYHKLELDYQKLSNKYKRLLGKKNDGKKNILMVAYYFPPLAGSGVYRSIKFAKYLPEFDCNVSVISATEPPKGWNFRDDSLCAEIPSCVDVTRIDDKVSTGKGKSSPEDVKFLDYIFENDKEVTKIMDKIKSQNKGSELLQRFPCAVLNWANKVAKYIDSIIDETDIDIIYTTSGPSSSHLVGYYINKKHGIPWVADFRDEWTYNAYSNTAERIETDISAKLLYLTEKSICHNASHVVTGSDISCLNYIKYFDLISNKITSITNGYDESDFEYINFKNENNNKFTIYYGGLLYTKTQNISPLIKIIDELIKKEKIIKDDLKFIFSGNSKYDLEKIFSKFDLIDNCELKEYQEHHVVLKEMVNADLLVCLIGDGMQYKGVYTGKIFEYLRACIPILALASEGGLVGEMLKENGHGRAIESTDNEQLKKYILEKYNNWKQSYFKEYLTNENIDQFERRNLTSKLNEIFDMML